MAAEDNVSKRVEKVLTWWDTFIKAFVGISTLGASITFNLILSDIANPSTVVRNARFSSGTVRIYLAISWLLFVMVLGVSTISGRLLLDPLTGQQDEGRKLDREAVMQKKVIILSLTTWLDLFSLVVEGLTITAFMFLSLAVAAYVPVVGWIGVAFVSPVAIVVLLLWSTTDISGLTNLTRKKDETESLKPGLNKAKPKVASIEEELKYPRGTYESGKQRSLEIQEAGV